MGIALGLVIAGGDRVLGLSPALCMCVGVMGMKDAGRGAELYEVYMLNGVRVKDISSARGIVIVRQGGHSWLIRR